MPCDSSYMEPNHKEYEMSKVAYLWDEINGRGKPSAQEYKAGMHPRVYNKGLPDYECDKMVRLLCDRLKSTVEFPSYSLELQIWWRDHQEADMKKLQAEMDDKKTDDEKKAALKKLSDYERKLLGVR